LRRPAEEAKENEKFINVTMPGDHLHKGSIYMMENRRPSTYSLHRL
jgi:hypothetical protein